MNKLALKNGLNRVFAERVYFAPRGFIMACAKASEEEVMTLLESWRDRGYLRILADIRQVEEDGTCIELLDWIDDPRSGNSPRG